VRAVDGRFGKGDAVVVRDEAGREIGRACRATTPPTPRRSAA